MKYSMKYTYIMLKYKDHFILNLPIKKLSCFVFVKTYLTCIESALQKEISRFISFSTHFLNEKFEN
jgi:hypothetical protein